MNGELEALEGSIDIINDSVVIAQGPEAGRYYNAIQAIVSEMDVDGSELVRLVPTTVDDMRFVRAEVGAQVTDFDVELTQVTEVDGYQKTLLESHPSNKGLIKSSHEHCETYPNWMPDREAWQIDAFATADFVSYMLYCERTVVAPLSLLEEYTIFDGDEDEEVGDDEGGADE